MRSSRCEDPRRSGADLHHFARGFLSPGQADGKGGPAQTPPHDAGSPSEEVVYVITQLHVFKC